MEKHSLTLSNGEKLAYQERGKPGGRPLVLIHGNMSSSLHYEPLIQQLETDHHILAPDLRGFGDSTYHQPIDSLADFAEDVAEFLDKKGIENATIAGWSTGGGVAMALAAKGGRRVGRLVLIESCAPEGLPIYEKDASLQPTDKLYQDKEALAQDPVQVAPILQALEKNDADFMRQVWEATIYTVKKPDEAYLERTIEETLKQRNLVDVDWALLTFNMTDDHNGVTQGDGSIQHVDVPTLAIYGKADAVISEAMFERTVAALPQAETVVYEKSGHSPIVDVPDDLAERIRNFHS